MYRDEDAVNEQLRSLICPVVGINSGKKDSVASYHEITGNRRRQDKLLSSQYDATKKAREKDKDKKDASLMKNKRFQKCKGESGHIHVWRKEEGENEEMT